MSSSTPEVRMRRDGALICAQKLPRGRCNKLLATKGGKLVCDNHHIVSLFDVADTYIQNTDFQWQTLELLNPSVRTLDCVLEKVTSQEFVAPDSNLQNIWKSGWFYYDPALFHQLIKRAEKVKPRAAICLKTIWESRLEDWDPLVWRYLRRLREEDCDRYAVVRERALLAFTRYASNDPLRYFHWSPIQLEAAEYFDDPWLIGYQHNVEEAADWVAGRTPIALYFEGIRWKKAACFNIQPDPAWKQEGWRYADSIQISLYFDDPEVHGDYNHWSIHNWPTEATPYHQVLDKTIRASKNLVQKEFREDEIFVTFEAGGTDHLSFIWHTGPPENWSLQEELLYLAKEVRSWLLGHLPLNLTYRWPAV